MNVNKRDRRSIEELEHEPEAKKSKTTEDTTGGKEEEEGVSESVSYPVS